MRNFTREYIESIPKTIMPNGCWIPHRRIGEDGYVRVSFGRYPNNRRYKLHRISLCVYYNINYDNKDIVARHSSICTRACFNPDHLKPGSKSENVQDSVRDRTYVNSAKTKCGKCGGSYSFRSRNGKLVRHCLACNRLIAKAYRQRKAGHEKRKLD